MLKGLLSAVVSMSGDHAQCYGTIHISDVADSSIAHGDLKRILAQ